MSNVRNIKKVNSVEPAFDAEITRTGDPAGKKYLVTAERMEDVNWRDDESLSFKMAADTVPPASDGYRTVIKTTSDGKTWLAAPGAVSPIDITNTYVSEGEKILWNSKADGSALNDHVDISDVKGRHVSVSDRSNWNAKPDAGNVVARSNIANIVYGTDGSGNPSNRSVGGGDGNIAQRTVGGNIAVPTAPEASDHAASKNYVDDRTAKLVWSYADWYSAAADIGPQVDIPASRLVGLEQDNIFFVHVHRGNQRQMYTGVWATDMEMVLWGDAMVRIGENEAYLHRIRIWPNNGNYSFRSEVAKVAATGYSDWRTEGPGFFKMLYIIKLKWW